MPRACGAQMERAQMEHAQKALWNGWCLSVWCL